MRIDFVSDVACPWCAVGLNALERALDNIGDDFPVELHFQPFELNQTMAPEGADAAEYLRNKYGMSDAQLASNRANIRARGAAVGFEFGERAHVWNTFDAHRLLHWAGLQDAQASAADDTAPGQAGAQPQSPPQKQRALKHALLQAYHGKGRNPGAHDVLLDLAGQVGLDVETARDVLLHDTYADEVRAAEQFWQDAGISGVPAIIINERHLISGGQPPEVFERALREIAAQG